MNRSQKFMVTSVFFAGLSLGIFVGSFITPAHADPLYGCNGVAPSYDGTCDWWRNLPSQGEPGTWGPTSMGPGQYTPCTYDRGCGIGAQKPWEK